MGGDVPESLVLYLSILWNLGQFQPHGLLWYSLVWHHLFLQKAEPAKRDWGSHVLHQRQPVTKEKPRELQNIRISGVRIGNLGWILYVLLTFFLSLHSKYTAENSLCSGESSYPAVIVIMGVEGTHQDIPIKGKECPRLFCLSFSYFHHIFLNDSIDVNGRRRGPCQSYWPGTLKGTWQRLGRSWWSCWFAMCAMEVVRF